MHSKYTTKVFFKLVIFFHWISIQFHPPNAKKISMELLEVFKYSTRYFELNCYKILMVTFYYLTGPCIYSKLHYRPKNSGEFVFETGHVVTKKKSRIF